MDTSQKDNNQVSDSRGPRIGVTPILVVDDADAAVTFYKSAFGAQEIARVPAPDGKRLLHVRLEMHAR